METDNNMQHNKREAIIYWNPSEKRDKNTYNLLKQLTPHIREKDIRKDTITATQLMEILGKLDRRAEDLVDKDSDPYKKQFKNVELEEDGWVQALVANPGMLYTPIVFLDDRGMIVDTPSRVLDLDPSHGFNDFKT